MVQYPTDKRLLPDEKPTLGFESGLYRVGNAKGHSIAVPLHHILRSVVNLIDLDFDFRLAGG